MYNIQAFLQGAKWRKGKNADKDKKSIILLMFLHNKY